MDKKHDKFLDFEEFKTQLPLLMNITIDENDLNIFFDYLDEYKTNKIDINIFRSKLRLFNDEIKRNHENDSLRRVLNLNDGEQLFICNKK